MRNTRIIKLCGSMVYQTKKAYLLQLDGYGKRWFPKSQVQDDGTGVFLVPEWLLDKSEEVEDDPEYDREY